MAQHRRDLGMDIRIPKDPNPAAFQSRVNAWLTWCFGLSGGGPTKQRALRFTEESLELAQSCGVSEAEVHTLVSNVFGRPVGQQHQEVGGTLVTLAALCHSIDLGMTACGEVELTRRFEYGLAIRSKAASEREDSCLPGGIYIGDE